MVDSIKSAIKSGHGNALIYTAAISFILADTIPTPADAFYFSYQRKMKEKLEKGEITPKKYWTTEAVSYYMSNIVWWSLVLGAVYVTKGDYTKKAKIGIGLIAAGAVIGVLHKNIQKDEELLKGGKK